MLDTLAAQVHGENGRRPDYLDPQVEVVVGDVTDRDTLARALQGVDAVYHFAAAVGVGQSMYEVAHYTRVNNLGTAVLLEALIAHPVERLVVASSMSLYGEGLYRTSRGEVELFHRELERSGMDSSKAKKEIGWEASVPLEEGVPETYRALVAEFESAGA